MQSLAPGRLVELPADRTDAADILKVVDALLGSGTQRAGPGAQRVPVGQVGASAAATSIGGR